MGYLDLMVAENQQQWNDIRLITPTLGKIKVLGKEIEKNRSQILQKMNFISPFIDLPKKLTVEQNLKVFGNLDVSDLNEKIPEILEKLKIQKLEKDWLVSCLLGKKIELCWLKH